MKTLCSGVNIKTEKAGGAINSLRTALEAKELGLEVMLGSMVSTHLGCTQTFSLHPLTRYLDVDGALLVKQPQL
jgi:L-alanine-DL-glutamate epimerase-like enolase superfamily enzyme